jgi:hypothetical protein
MMCSKYMIQSNAGATRKALKTVSHSPVDPAVQEYNNMHVYSVVHRHTTEGAAPIAITDTTQ